MTYDQLVLTCVGWPNGPKILRRLVYEFEQRKSSHTYVDLRRIETGRLAIGFTGELGLLHETLKVIKKTKGAREYRR